MIDTELTGKRREILDFIATQLRDRGYPPSVREIGEAVGLTSSSTVHTHLTTLQRQGYLRRDPTKPRAIEVRYDTNSGIAIDRRPARHVPLVGEVAAGIDVLAEENIEELLPAPGGLHRRRAAVHAQGAGRLHDRRRDPGRGLRGRPPARRGRQRRRGRRRYPRRRSDRQDATAAAAPRWCSRRPTRPCPRWSSAPDEVDLYGKVVTVLRRL